jgi:hypothetical protein
MYIIISAPTKRQTKVKQIWDEFRVCLSKTLNGLSYKFFADFLTYMD